MTAASAAALREDGGSVSAFLEALQDTEVLTAADAVDFLGGFPAATVVEPRSTEEVERVMTAAHAAGVKVIPAGAGTWLSAGGWASSAVVALSTRRLNAVEHYEPADLTATVGAGLAWTAFQSLLAEHNQWLPLDPPGVRMGTVGGVVASGVSGSLRGHFGATRDAVLGLEVVTGDGRRLEVGGRVVKNVAGYDLVRLLTGSRGSLGVITRVSVRLFPIPTTDLTAVFSGPFADVLRMARSAASATMPIASIELLGGTDWSVAVRLLGGAEEVKDSRARLIDLLGHAPSKTLEAVESAAFHAQQTEWEDGSSLVVRLAALPGLIDRCLTVADELTAVFGGDISAHVTQGIVRVRVPALSADDSAKLPGALNSARTQLEELGGGLIVSTAPADMGGELAFTGGLGGQAQVSERLRALFDPNEVLASRCP